MFDCSELHHLNRTYKVTFRRDKESNRPRVNKPGTGKDREQKAAREYYYQPREGEAE